MNGYLLCIILRRGDDVSSIPVGFFETIKYARWHAMRDVKLKPAYRLGYGGYKAAEYVTHIAYPFAGGVPHGKKVVIFNENIDQ